MGDPRIHNSAVRGSPTAPSGGASGTNVPDQAGTADSTPNLSLRADAGLSLRAKRSNLPVDQVIVAGQNDSLPTYPAKKWAGGILLAQADPGSRKPAASAQKPFKTEEDRNTFETFGLPTLKKWGVPTGKALERLTQLSNGAIGEMIHFALRRLMDAKVITPSLLREDLGTGAKWLDNLARAAGDMNHEQRWKVFYFGFNTLLEAKILKRENLEDLFQYRKGLMLYEMARATHLIDAGRDYFGYMLADWLLETNAPDLNAAVIGKFIQETSVLAGEFYKAGREQRKKNSQGDTPPMWRLVVGNFRGLLPLDDLPELLRLLTRVLKDPYDNALAATIQKKKNQDILSPKTVEDIRHIRSYGQFLEQLTQVANLGEKWVRKNVSLKRLNNRYRNREPEIVMDVISVLNSFIESYGDEWLMQAGVPLPYWEGSGNPVEVPVDVTTLQAIFARHYIIRRLKPDALKEYRFVWQNGKPGQITVSNLSRMILMHNLLREIVGEEVASKVFDEIEVETLKLDLRGIPEEAMTIKGLNTMRVKLNEQSSSMRREEGGRVLMGDRFIRHLTQMLATAIMVPADDPRVHEGGRYVAIDLMVRIFMGWSNFSDKSYDFSYDLEGNYKSLAGYVGAGVRDYFDNHRAEFAKREDGNALRRRLKGLERPLWLDRKRDMSDELMDFLEKNE